MARVRASLVHSDRVPRPGRKGSLFYSAYAVHIASGVFTGVYFARPLNPVESISIFQTAPRPATYNVLFFGPLKARPWQS